MTLEKAIAQIHKELELLTDCVHELNCNLKRIADNTDYLRIKGGN